MTFDTKFTIALAGCSGSCSANRWHTLSVALPCFLATNPNTLQTAKNGRSGSENRYTVPYRGNNSGLLQKSKQLLLGMDTTVFKDCEILLEVPQRGWRKNEQI